MERIARLLGVIGIVFGLAIANISLAGGWTAFGKLINGWSGFWGALLLFLALALIPLTLTVVGRMDLKDDTSALVRVVAIASAIILALVIVVLVFFNDELAKVNQVVLWIFLINTAAALVLYFGLGWKKKAKAPTPAPSTP